MRKRLLRNDLARFSLLNRSKVRLLTGGFLDKEGDTPSQKKLVHC